MLATGDEVGVRAAVGPQVRGLKDREHGAPGYGALAAVGTDEAFPEVRLSLAGENFALQAPAGILVADGRVVPALGVNYDQAGAWIIARGAGSVTAVAERLKPEAVYQRFVAFREGLGIGAAR
jgi:hypothetical protein